MIRRAAVLVCLSAVLLGPAADAAPAMNGPVTADDERALALGMYHSARNSGRQGMLAIGWVILNRVNDKEFPKTIYDVVYQRRGKGCEWGWTCDSRPDEPVETKHWENAQALAKELLGANPPPDPTMKALWQQEAWRKPSAFTKNLKKTATIGKNVFYARK